MITEEGQPESIILEIDKKVDLQDNSTFAFPLLDGEEIIALNNNIPCFTEEEPLLQEYIQLSELDSLRRCGPAVGCIGNGLLAKEPRSSIRMIKPSGWHTVKYKIIDGKYLYNRSHMID